MPLFMDRHDVPGMTAAEVAQAHMADLDAGAKFGAQFLAYWFDADQGEAFCLAKAPTGDSLTAVHQETNGLIPTRSLRSPRTTSCGSSAGRARPAATPQASIPSGRSCSRTCRVRRRCSKGRTIAFMVLLTEHDMIIRRALVAAHGRE